MNRRNAFLALLLLAVAVFLVWTQTSLRAADHGTLKVGVRYTGAGVVDKQHQVYVLLCDANPFASTKLLDATARPTAPTPEPGAARVLAVEGTAAKDGFVTFHNVPVATVYAVVLFDKNGGFNGRLDSLPPGEPIGAFGMPPDKLEPIQLNDGKTVEVAVAFGDSAFTP